MGQKLRRSPLFPWAAMGVALVGLFLLTPLRFLVQSWFGWPVPIRALHQTRLLHNQSVTIDGQITRRVPLIGGHIYQVQDATGQVWVVSSTTTLQPGQSVTLEGIARFESIVMAGEEQGEVYLEQGRTAP